MKTGVFLAIALFIASVSFAGQRGDTRDLVDQILSDVVDHAIYEGKRVVRENTGIDLRDRGYRSRERYSRDISDEKHRELRKLGDEHDRKIDQLYDELDMKLAKSRDEFEREAAKEDKREKIEEKRDKLREKVDEAYAKFDEKVEEENRRFDEKRWDILNK